MDDEDVGEPLRVIRGKYAGCSGFVNLSRSNTKKFIQVWIQDDDGRLTACRVKRTSVRSPFRPAQTFEDAIIQQHPDIELALVQLAEMFASCDIQNTRRTLELLDFELSSAMSRMRESGANPRYRGVRFPAPPAPAPPAPAPA